MFVVRITRSVFLFNVNVCGTKILPLLKRWYVIVYVIQSVTNTKKVKERGDFPLS